MTLQLARISMLVVSVMFAAPSRGLAHAASAPPPIFDPGPCILTIDRTAMRELGLGYQVDGDGVPLSAGDIALPDAMTHQFFALRGAILFEGFVPELWSFDPADRMIAPLPLWITDDDVTRAQNSSDSARFGYDLSPAHEAVLDKSAALAQRWLRITPDTARAPITRGAAQRGVRWNVSAVDPGLYTIAAYIFSPPYNGWGIRSGLVKITDPDHDPAAALPDPIQETLFAGQGRIVRACLDVPSGTRLTSYALSQDRPDLGWVAWGEERAVHSGSFEDCFDPASTGLSGPLRLRFDLTDPAGAVTAFYSPDTLSVLAGALPCEASNTICCPSKPAVDGCKGSAVCDAVMEPSDASPAADPASHSDSGAATATHGKRSTSGCAVTGAAPDGRPAVHWIALALALVLLVLSACGRRRAERPRN